MTDKATTRDGGLRDTVDGPTIENGVKWYEGAEGERLMVRLSSRDTGGGFTIIESICTPGACVPMHYHEKEEEHFVIVEGTVRFVRDGHTIDASAGMSITMPKGSKHAWRNISNKAARMLIILTPGGFEQLLDDVIGVPLEKRGDVAARHGIFVVGPPIEA
jgi:mannose-6-phosphate isomerase-like protein (cupin superfamily)